MKERAPTDWTAQLVLYSYRRGQAFSLTTTRSNSQTSMQIHVHWEFTVRLGLVYLYVLTYCFVIAKSGLITLHGSCTRDSKRHC